MRTTNVALSLMTAAMLASCGGGGGGDGGQPWQPPPVHLRYSSQVTFGDALSDVGSYAVGGVLNAGGGKFTINGDNTAVNPALTGKNWTELMAAEFGLPAPCAAQTGLNGDPTHGFLVPVVVHAGCFGYAQGGARVTEPIGVLNGFPLGALTVPIADQVASHLNAVGGMFKGDEIVLVNGGGADLGKLLQDLRVGADSAATEAARTVGDSNFANTLASMLAVTATYPGAAEDAIRAAVNAELDNPAHTIDSLVAVAVSTAAAQPGNAAVAAEAVYVPLVNQALAASEPVGQVAAAKASARYIDEHGQQAIAAMAQAATDLGDLVKNQIIGKGATHIVVQNLINPSSTPGGTRPAENIRQLAIAMAVAFNDSLKSCLGNLDKVLLVDLDALVKDEVANPAQYGLTYVTDVACGPNLFVGLSLFCNGTNTLPGVDVSHYLFADDFFGTPFQGTLIARNVSEKMKAKGWL